ncbi:MAG: DUF4097 domain-containing protein [Clostridia bacterium]|nr:DUF4097 domain-containing protein [Clostridia bacterium]
MKEFQKILKYVAIAFGLYLAITIISAIVGVVLAITTGIYGISYLTEQSEANSTNITEQYEQVNKLKLEIGASNIVIKEEGTVFRVETEKTSKTMIIRENQGTLEIRDTKKNLFNKDRNIVIYVPEGTKFSEIQLEIGAGTVNIRDINADKVDFSFGAGSVNIDNLVCSKTKIECGAGEVIINNSDFGNTELDTGIGRLVYSGYLRNSADIECGVGEVDLNLLGGEEAYTIKAEKGIGDIRINGDSVANESTIGNGENKISIDGGVGSIKIDM